METDGMARRVCCMPSARSLSLVWVIFDTLRADATDPIAADGAALSVRCALRKDVKRTTAGERDVSAACDRRSSSLCSVLF
eukprot:gene658-biopygen675